MHARTGGHGAETTRGGRDATPGAPRVDVAELRRLILAAAPDPAAARPAADCGEDQPLDALMPFSSLIVLGVVVAIEDRYGVRVTRQALRRALGGGVTLRALARMVEELPRGRGRA